MDWKRVSAVLERFERISKNMIKELKQHYRRIQQLEAENDFVNAAIEKNNAKHLVDQLLAGLQQIIVLRNELNGTVTDIFDTRLEPTRQQIQMIINAFERLLQQQQHQSSSSSAFINGEDKTTNDNIFYDCFNNNTDKTTEYSIYEKQLLIQTKANPKAEELRIRAEEAKMDADATKKLADEIEDLNQVMTDLSQLVHSQHELVDSIEAHVERSNQQVQTGHQQLKKAVTAKNAKYPFIAAVCGSVVVGGPVGVAAGSAVAGLFAAVGGAFAGLLGGRAIKKQVQKEATSEKC